MVSWIDWRKIALAFSTAAGEQGVEWLLPIDVPMPIAVVVLLIAAALFAWGIAPAFRRPTGIASSGRVVTLPKRDVQRWRDILAAQERVRRNQDYILRGLVNVEPIDWESINERAVHQVRIELGLDAPSREKADDDTNN